MSSILKALRKLEEEKAALGEGGVDLARDILKRSAPKRDSKSPQAIKILFFCLFFVVVVLTAAFMLSMFKPAGQVMVPTVKNSVEHPDLTIKQPVTAAPVKTADEPGSSTVATIPEKETQPVVQSIVITEQAPTSQVEETLQQEPVLPAALETVAEPVEPTLQVENIPELEAPIGSAEAKAEGLPQEENPIIITELPPELAALKIDMIVFKPEPNERLAIINDLPVMEGTMVDDFLILEILKNGVQVVWQDQTYHLPFEGQPAP